jgi:uncharacterized phage protein gp47/JayE
MAVKSAADIVAEMISSLKVSDPEIDSSIGSTVRKILDVIGEQIAPAYAENYLISYVWNVETKSGSELDDFCAMFGIYRMAAKRAIGVVNFSRPTAATVNILIPANTQISTGTIPQVVFVTASPAILLKGTTNVSVPVQAVVGGESGNLPADALSVLLTPVQGVASTTKQSDATTGGTNEESDEALKARFKRTVFRSMAGTEDMFMGVAIEDSTPDDSSDTIAVQANVIGANKFWREQVQVVDEAGTLVAYSTIPPGSVKHIYAGTSFFGEDLESGQILTEGVHYEFDSTVTPPKITGLTDALDEGRVYDLQFEYVPMASRNDPANNITNRIDIWVSGISPQDAVETTYWRPKTFSATTTSKYFADNFVRLSDDGEVAPTVGNKFLPLAWGPILTFPEELVIAGTTYVRDTDYWVVHDDTGFGYSPTSMFGLEWLASNAPPVDSQISLSEQQAYTYNRLPADVEARARKWKLVATDVKAHAAKQVRLVLNFAVMYDPAYERGVVQAAVDSALANWMQTLGFHAVVQVSDLLAVAHNVAGVDNIRFLNSLETSTGDADDWGIQHVSSTGVYLSHYSSGATPARARDIVLAENEVATLYDVRYVTRAQNTFREPDA